MIFHQTSIPGVVEIEAKILGDSRGYFMEFYHQDRFREAGIDVSFVQDNMSSSTKNVLRGLHYQLGKPQGKLVSVFRGEVFDVAVDIRKGSPTFGKWTYTILTEEKHNALYIPPGFAHGFCVLSDYAEFFYKCSELYYPQGDRSIRWNDPEIGVEWPVKAPLLSDKDKLAPFMKDAELTTYNG